MILCSYPFWMNFGTIDLIEAFLAVGTARDTVRDGPQSLRLPIRARDSSTVGPRDDPGYGLSPLKINATQKNYLSPYTVELSIGWPPQLVYPALDLFSSNIWVDPDCDSSLSPDACCANGNYDPDASFSSEDLDCSQTFEFMTTYGSASGCYVVDKVQFAGADLGNIQVGVANESWAQTAGRIGLGFGCNSEDDTLIIDTLRSQGLIATRQFSIALGSANPSSGSHDDAPDVDVGLGELLFSGLNVRKYAGGLRRLQSHQDPDGGSRQYVQLTALGIFDPNNCLLRDMLLPSRNAYLDFTTIISYLPWVYMDMLTSFFPDATYNRTGGVYQVPCYHRFQDASVDFYFDTLVIRVPSRDFILQVDGICYLGAIESAEQNEVILGQSFLRGAYTAFDLDDEAIYMAQYENCGDELIGWDEAASDEVGSCVLNAITLPPSCSSTSTTTSPYYTPPTTSTTTTHSTTTRSSRTTSTSHSSTRSSTRSTRTSTSHRTTSTSRSTSHSSTHTSTHSTTSTTSRYRTTSSSSSSRTSSSSRRSTSSHTPGSPTPYVPSTTATYPTTSFTSWSSGIFPTGGTGASSGTFVTPSSGFSWSNVSFTPGGTGRTPTPTSTLTSLPASGSYLSETSALTSVPESSSAGANATQSLSLREPPEKTVTVTVGLFTTTIFLPSPITVPVSTCNCSKTTTREPATVTRAPEGLTFCPPTAALTEYRTRTVSWCGSAEHTTTRHSTRRGPATPTLLAD
ncbi:acid protease [Nemania sp. FL0031]|nr:acid protease [Nemania sp. FL0031]